MLQSCEQELAYIKQPRRLTIPRKVPLELSKGIASKLCFIVLIYLYSIHRVKLFKYQTKVESIHYKFTTQLLCMQCSHIDRNIIRGIELRLWIITKQSHRISSPLFAQNLRALFKYKERSEYTKQYRPYQRFIIQYYIHINNDLRIYKRRQQT